MNASNWSSATAPDLRIFRDIAHEAFANLPEEFRSRCDGIVIAIEYFPSEAMPESVGAEDPFDLLGLFEGLGLAQTGDNAVTGQQPNRVWLFRRPILDYWAAYEESLGVVITHVLVHEIGHHFGLSDEDMEAIEADG
ncbi:metallopeptidase family protein [Breoghania sp.]|uniref:metallopeptidase family protein n=1 Tax=Breoghania sp. TaxID=2065378 RepID=UPI002612618B|nr:metallopeptidase family protein [Breoghania sp.]MDJ0932621.1 metallopeptidase family protein [Breoghania sp.]